MAATARQSAQPIAARVVPAAPSRPNSKPTARGPSQTSAITSSVDALKSAVASQIRRLVADIWYTLQLSDGGAIRVAARVVARIAREAARDVAGVRVAFGRSTHSRMAGLVERATLRHRHPNAAVGVLGRTAVVDLAIAARYGTQLDTIARPGL